MFWPNGLRLFIVAALLSISSLMYADETASGADSNGFLSLGIGLHTRETPYSDSSQGGRVFFNGRYQWKGLFAEVASGPDSTRTLPAIGYNFYSAERWNLDLLTSVTHGRTQLDYELDGQSQEFSRSPMVDGGIRATGAYGDTTLQFLLMPWHINKEDLTGAYTSFFISHSWQIRNWVLDGTVGAIYRPSSVMDYYYGVDPDESNILFPQYQADSGADYIFQLDLSYPLTRHWVFQSYMRYTVFSDSVLDSPLIIPFTTNQGRPEQGTEAGILFNYVF